MISFSEALKIVLNVNYIMGTERINITNSTGRILAENVVSDINMPPFNKAAMDGFAIREVDIDKELTIIETIAAGQTPAKEVKPGHASKIMTGAPIPEGADFVIQVELSEMVSENKVQFTGHPKNNIIPIAEDVKIGDIVLKKGQKINAQHIAVLASVGHVNPLVYKKPQIGIISTGDEIVEPENKPQASQIRNSNGYQILAQVLQCNATPNYLGIVKDDYQATKKIISTGLDNNDILLLSGGVSMGEFDFVPKILQDLGITLHFDKVAVQPGKPTTFGTKDNKIIFGLPGNPVSSFVQFEILVKPLIERITGQTPTKFELKLPLGANFKRKKNDRTAYVPITISENSEVFTSEYHGSAHIAAFINANGFAVIPEGTTEINKGELVHVRLL